MRDQRLADVAPPALNKREDARMQTAGGNRLGHRLRDDLAGSGMRRMALDHHRAACRQRRGGVAARGRERQREVRGAKDRHRPDRALHQPQIWAGQRLALGQRRVMAPVEVIALQDVPGEQPQLSGRAPALALQPRRRQPGLLTANLGDRRPARLDRIGDRVQERRALRPGRPAETRETCLGRRAGGLDVARRADRKLPRGPARRRRMESRIAANPFPRNQMLSAQFHAHD